MWIVLGLATFAGTLVYLNALTAWKKAGEDQVGAYGELLSQCHEMLISDEEEADRSAETSRFGANHKPSAAPDAAAQPPSTEDLVAFMQAEQSATATATKEAVSV